MLRRFILQARDPRTGCPILEAQLRLECIEGLRALLGEDADDDPEIKRAYELGADGLPALWSFVGFEFPAEIETVHLQPWHATRAVPYLIHTGFELALMLEGRKPLAVFTGVHPTDTGWLDRLLEPFASHVAAGRIVRRVVDRAMVCETKLAPELSHQRLRRVLFALPGQEWRVDAYILMMDVSQKAGWNDAFERYEGALLGYETWQSDWWADKRKTMLSTER